jgi:tetratricopeptide (TPR) repeat protein
MHILAAVLLCLQTATPAFRLYEKANTLFVAKKLPECQKALEEALRLDPKLVPALTLKAKLAMGMNRFEEARQSLEQAIAVEPSSWYAHFLLGFQYHLQNDLPLALPELEKARKLNPRDARPAIYLGLTQESLGHTEEAIRLYEEAIRLEAAGGKPQADTLLTYARLLFALGRLEQCAKLIERALELEPNSRDVHFERGRLLMKKGDPAGAAKEGEQALGLPASGIPDRPIHYLLVRAYRMSGQEGLAEEHAAALRGAETRDSGDLTPHIE